ncbi:hypothetical protein ACFO5X_07350 [Seohaeicola nanhaiensis]|uniref:Uncharacterized protein n=1 Tax=Seohaeicola nanhaiensis TaxID=1387282 RepID=A0ABV9KEN4_9RHOB
MSAPKDPGTIWPNSPQRLRERLARLESGIAAARGRVSALDSWVKDIGEMHVSSAAGDALTAAEASLAGTEAGIAGLEADRAAVEADRYAEKFHRLVEDVEAHTLPQPDAGPVVVKQKPIRIRMGASNYSPETAKKRYRIERLEGDVLNVFQRLEDLEKDMAHAQSLLRRSEKPERRQG